jgi:hypothetical protein
LDAAAFGTSREEPIAEIENLVAAENERQPIADSAAKRDLDGTQCDTSQAAVALAAAQRRMSDARANKIIFVIFGFFAVALLLLVIWASVLVTDRRAHPFLVRDFQSPEPGSSLNAPTTPTADNTNLSFVPQQAPRPALEGWRRRHDEDATKTPETARTPENNAVPAVTIRTEQAAQATAPPTPKFNVVSSNSVSVTTAIENKCHTEWPTDFVMQAYCQKQQQEAVRNLGSGKPSDIAQADFVTIRTKFTREWPTDFVMQAYCQKQQFGAIGAVRR